jgi:hypothetical protein
MAKLKIKIKIYSLLDEMLILIEINPFPYF